MRFRTRTAMPTSVARTAIRERAQRVADHAFVAADRSLRQCPTIVARGLLPSHAPAFGMIRRCSSRCVGAVSTHAVAQSPQHQGNAQNCTINLVSVVSPIAGECDWTRRSIEQRPDLRAVIDIVCGQLRRDDFASVGVRAKILVNLSRVEPSGVVLCRTMHGSQHRSLRADRQRGQFDILREDAPIPFHR
jgi:hypothetical protein